MQKTAKNAATTKKHTTTTRKRQAETGKIKQGAKENNKNNEPNINIPMPSTDNHKQHHAWSKSNNNQTKREKHEF